MSPLENTVPSSPTYALVVDDHPLVARGLSEFIRLHPGIGETECVETAEQALHLVARKGTPAVALVDFWLAQGSTAHFICDLLALAPSVRILMVSGDNHPAIALKAQSTGAHGFVGKHQPPEVFEAALTAVLGGGTWFDSVASPALPHTPRDVPLSPADLGMTPRQGQILVLLLDGQPNKFIASHLNLSEHTVKEHVTSILGKLGARNRVEAIAKLRGVRLELPH